jgi:hypothetical protein
MPKFTIPSSIPLKIIYVLLGALTLFQLALIFGVPWGHAAWGGQYRVLPTLYRFGSASSILLYGLFVWVFRQREKHPQRKKTKVLAWIIFGYSVIGVVMNSLSSSRLENFIWAPVSAILAICMYLIARPPRNIYGPYSYYP